jgi:YD repeat-containing protein
MYKNNALFFILVLVFCGFHTQGQPKHNDLFENNLKGKAKTVRTIAYEGVKKGNEVEKGNVIHIDKEEMNYNNFTKTNLMQNFIALQYYDWTNSLKTYDKKGFLVEEIRYEDETNIQYNKFVGKRDRKGNILEWNLFDEQDSLAYRYVACYDTNHLLVGWKIYEQKELIERWEMSYDEKENIIEADHYNDKDKKIDSYIFTYDDKDNLINLQQYDLEQNNKKIEEVNFSYDSNNKLIIPNEDEIDEQYEYDDEGNWVKKIMYGGSITTIDNVVIIERKIEYYK